LQFKRYIKLLIYLGTLLKRLGLRYY